MKNKRGRPNRKVYKSGDKVTIYYDPFNNYGVEGEATLISLFKKRKKTDLWFVCFADGFRCKRAIRHELEPIKNLEVKMNKRNWNSLTKKQKRELIELGDRLYIPPNFVQYMYENNQIEIPSSCT
ncbi:MAG: hypothetical protein U9O94_10705 [Nanoarchaeota archaeon]|nr:hypothetical protein [Nanoarchaeota archaeon]